MSYTPEFFQPHLNTPFSIQLQENKTTELLLEEVKNQSSNNDAFHQFSLFFTGSSSAPLTQGTYTLTHAYLPEQAIFIVPVAKTEQSYRYQACFNIAK